MIVDDLFESSATDFFKQLQKTNPKFKNLRIHGDPEHDELRRQDLAAQQARRGEQQQQAQQAAGQRIEQDRANLPALVAQLKTLMTKFDPNFEYSDDHSFWTQQRALKNQIGELKSRIKAAGMNITESRINEIDWKGIQKKASQFQKGAQKFTQNVAQTGQSLGGAASALGGAAKEVGKQFIAKPVAATYGAAKSGLSKAADITKGVYGDVKKGLQTGAKGLSTATTDIGQGGQYVGKELTKAGKGIQSLGRGAANVAGGAANAVGATVGGATTGLGRSTTRGFNAGVKNTGGQAVNRLQTNVFKQQPAAQSSATGTAQSDAQPATAQVDQRMPSSALNPATGLAWTQPEIAQWRAASAPDTTAVAPATTTTTATTAPAARKTVSMNVAKQAIDTAAQALTKVRTRDRAKVAQYAQSKLLQIGQPSPVAAKPTWKGRKPSGAGLTKQQKDSISKIGVDESLSWSKDFDPSRSIWNKINSGR
jgi:hypothetical protein